MKLFRMFSRHVEVLHSLQSKGEQRMIVEHVHVHNGGQAIVGSINQGSNKSSSLSASNKTFLFSATCLNSQHIFRLRRIVQWQLSFCLHLPRAKRHLWLLPSVGCSSV